MTSYQKCIQGDTRGYKLAKLHYNWMQLTKFEEQGYASSIVSLAELIDREFANG